MSEEPFDCLKNSDYHPRVVTIFAFFKFGTLMGSTRFYHKIPGTMMRFVPKSMMQQVIENQKLAANKVSRRLNLDTDYSDFMSPVINFDGEQGMTIDEIGGTFNIVIIAGGKPRSLFFLAHILLHKDATGVGSSSERDPLPVHAGGGEDF
ncbi:MAG: hypothetical protein Q9167_006297 [Letrouitia subvulpina]